MDILQSIDVNLLLATGQKSKFEVARVTGIAICVSAIRRNLLVIR